MSAIAPTFSETGTLPVDSLLERAYLNLKQNDIFRVDNAGAFNDAALADAVERAPVSITVLKNGLHLVAKRIFCPRTDTSSFEVDFDICTEEPGCEVAPDGFLQRTNSTLKINPQNIIALSDAVSYVGNCGYETQANRYNSNIILKRNIRTPDFGN